MCRGNAIDLDLASRPRQEIDDLLRSDLVSRFCYQNDRADFDQVIRGNTINSFFKGVAASTVLLTAALYEETDSFDGRNTDVADGSQNLNFGYLISGVPAVAAPPSVTAFDPNQGGYSFLFRAKDFGSVGIIVNVGEVSPVPLPAGLPRLALGLGALGIMRARRTA